MLRARLYIKRTIPGILAEPLSLLTLRCIVSSIVSEAGASIYSASPEAEKELPDMDVTLRGAGGSVYRQQTENTI